MLNGPANLRFTIRVLCWSLENIRDFLKSLRGSGVEQWRIEQARQAIAILYRDYLKIDLDSLGTKGASPPSAKDHVAFPEAVEAHYKDLFDAMRRVTPGTDKKRRKWVFRRICGC